MAYLESIINPFAINVGAVYLRFQPWIDAVIAFMIFFSVSNWVYSNAYKKHGGHGPSKEGKMIAVAVGLALTFGFVMFEMRTGFTFGGPSMQGIAGIILLSIFAILLNGVITSLTGEKNKSCALATTYVITFSLFLFPYSELYLLMTERFPVLGALLGIGYLIALIALIMCVVGMVKGMFGREHGEHGDGHGGHDNAHGDNHDNAHGTNSHAAHPPVDTSDLSHMIDQFEHATAAFIQALQNFMNAGHAVLVENHAAVTGATPNTANLNARMNDFLHAGAELAQRLHVMQQLSRTISHHQNVGHLPAAEAHRYGAVYQHAFAFCLTLSTYWMSWQTHFRNNTVPPHP